MTEPDSMQEPRSLSEADSTATAGSTPERDSTHEADHARRTVVVVAGGDPPVPHAAADLPADTYVIAADSGLDVAVALGLQVQLVVGDLDSVSDEGLADARRSQVAVEVHPVAKDQTDLELALDRAVAVGGERVVVIGGAGGRLDHVLAGALLLAHERYAGVEVEARFGTARLTVVRGHRALHGRRGELLTLLPLFGPARGVTTTGLRYALADEDLLPGSSRGVSNELEAPEATVTVRAGVLLAVQPEAMLAGETDSTHSASQADR